MDSYLQFVLSAIGIVFLSLGAGVVVGRKTKAQEISSVDYEALGKAIAESVASVLAKSLDDLSQRVSSLESTVAQSIGRCPEIHRGVDQKIDSEREARLAGDIALTATCSEIKATASKTQERVQLLGDMIHSER